MRGMNKRVAVTILWFIAGWYAGSYVALFLGISDMIGLILGISAAVVFGGDPLGIIWPRRVESPVAGSGPEELVERLAEAA